MRLAEFDALNLEPDLNESVRSYSKVRMLLIYLILQVVPPVRPSLLDTSFLFKNRLFDHGSQNAKCHSNSVVVITVNADSGLEFGDGLPINFKAIV